MKLRLLHKLMLLILTPVFAALLAFSGFSYLESKQVLRAQIDADMSIILNQQVEDYVRFFQNFERLSTSFSSQSEVIAGFETNGGSEVEQAVKELLRLYPHVKLVELLRPDGTRMFAQGTASSFVEYTKTDFFRKILNRQQSLEIFQKPNSQDIFVSVGVPVLQGQNLVGCVILSTPMELLGAQYSDRIRVGTTGKCFILDSKGVVLLDPTDKVSIGMDISSIPWIRTMLDSPSGMIQYTWNGIEKTCFYAHVKGLDLVVSLGFEDNDLLAPVIALRNTTLMISGLVLLLLAGIVYWIASTITNPLRSAAAYVREVGEGNMKVSAALHAERERACSRTDEIGELAVGIRNMHMHLEKMFTLSAQNEEAANTAAKDAQMAKSKAEEALHQAEIARRETVLDVTSQLEGIAETLSSAATALSARIEQSRRGANEQADRVTQTVTAMEEMNATVLEVARNSSVASSVSADTRSRAEEGAKVVGQVVDSIRDVQRRSLALKDDMSALGVHAGSISQIMSVISDIADQTNLLALNAAIEAARAGDAGRGFAVVADEVRKLAEKTMASTTDVGNAIRAIQQSATQNIAQVEEAVNKIAEATVLATKSGESLYEIVKMVDSTADQVRGIASASEQQAASSEEISQSIGTVNTIANETAVAMQDASADVQDLAAQATRLSRLIESIKKK